MKYFCCVEWGGRDDPAYAIAVLKLKESKPPSENSLREKLRAFFPGRVCDHKHAKFDNAIYVWFALEGKLIVRLEAFKYEWSEEKIALIPEVDRFLDSLGLERFPGPPPVQENFFDPASRSVVSPPNRQ